MTSPTPACVVVPSEPTDEMVSAAIRYVERSTPLWSYDRLYMAMLAASPTTHVTIERGELERLRKDVERLNREVLSEREARDKLDLALRLKDEAMSELFKACQDRGVDLSHMIP